MNDSVGIRRATIDDLNDVVRLYLSLKEHHARLQPGNIRYQVEDARWWETARRSLLDDAAACYVAETERETVAFMKLRFLQKVWGTSCEVETLVVEEALRARGVGARLLAAAEEEATRRAAVAMRVDVLTKNEGGLAFYAREGYEAFALRLGKSLKSSPEGASPTESP